MGTLLSPGVSITVTDESFFAGQGEGTIPLIVIATRENKPNPNDSDVTQSSIAPGTRPDQVGTLNLITSQRELLQTYGDPEFVVEAGTPSHGNELNEYGLHAAMQYLGIADRAWIIRADVPMQELEPLDVEPAGDPANGTYWLDLRLTEFGLFVGDLAQWNNIRPLLLNLDIPVSANTLADPGTVSQNGDFAIDIGNNLLGLAERIANIWYRVGSPDWITAKGTTNLVGGGNGPATVVYSPHTGIPPSNSIPTPNEGHVWVKTTNPNLGADYKVKIFNSTLELFSEIFCPLFETDAEATSFYGANLVAGSLYVDYNSSNSTHVIKRFDGSNWQPLAYEANLLPPVSDPEEGTLWFNNDFKVDIMVSDGSNWIGYRNRYPTSDPNGVQLTATAPITQSNGNPLMNQDLWIDTSDVENYPKIYRWNTGTLEWDLIDNTDQTTQYGIVFADARDLITINSTDPLDFLNSNDVDADAPDPRLYPAGTLLFNMRYSTLNVKKWTPNYIFEGIPVGDRWVTDSGLRPDGAPWMGRKAQRRVIVRAIQEVLVGNQDIRSEFIFFNLIAAPGYPDVIDEMITLNVDIKEIAFIVGDTPARLKPDGTSIQNYATNANVEPLNGEDARTAGVRNPYVGQWYPWGLSTNVDGNEVMIPPSAIALRTIAFNDQVAYPWFAPAGLQRGLVTNAQSVGYLDDEGEFKAIQLNQGQRDTLYVNNINPIAARPNRGLSIWGQKTLSPVTSALDRINVIRLINYIRFHLNELMQPFLFEPNDGETRESVTVTVERFLGDLLGKRALYDFGVRCDESNNTPTRIDRNELWVDIALKPVKAIEFIFIPIRILNTGDPIDSSNPFTS